MILSIDQLGFRIIIVLLAGLGIALAVAPVIAIIVLSFSADAYLSFPPSGLSLRWYVEAIRQIVGDEAGDSLSVGAALGTSLKVGALVMIASVIACVPLAYVMSRSRGAVWRMLDTLYSLPLILPVVVLGLAFLLTAEALGIELGIWRLAIPHMTLAFPFVLRNCVSAMSGIGVDLEEAAQSLGASRVRTFFEIVVPMMRPGIVSGLTFAFIVSFNEFTVTFFMYTIDLGTLPLWMYSRTVSSLDPTVLALSSLIIMFDLLVILAIDRLGGRRKDLF